MRTFDTRISAVAEHNNKTCSNIIFSFILYWNIYDYFLLNKLHPMVGIGKLNVQINMLCDLGELVSFLHTSMFKNETTVADDK